MLGSIDAELERVESRRVTPRFFCLFRLVTIHILLYYHRYQIMAQAQDPFNGQTGQLASGVGIPVNSEQGVPLKIDFESSDFR